MFGSEAINQIKFKLLCNDNKKKATSKLKNKLEWMVEGGKFRGLFLLKIFVAGT